MDGKKADDGHQGGGKEPTARKVLNAGGGLGKTQRDELVWKKIG